MFMISGISVTPKGHLFQACIPPELHMNRECWGIIFPSGKHSCVFFGTLFCIFIVFAVRKVSLCLFQMVSEIIEAFGYFVIFWFQNLVGVLEQVLGFFTFPQDSNSHGHSGMASKTSISTVWSVVYQELWRETGCSDDAGLAVCVPCPGFVLCSEGRLSFPNPPIWHGTPLLSPCFLDLLKKNKTVQNFCLALYHTFVIY